MPLVAHYGLVVYGACGQLRFGHDGEVVGAACDWRANTIRSDIDHAVHSAKSTPSRTSRTVFRPATFGGGRPTVATAASASDRRDGRT